MSTKQTINPVDVIDAIDSQLKKVHTQSLDLSFNELLDMKRDGELDISPDYQRLFRWTEGARSRFIESLLLEMPVPPIYVIEENDGKYLLIDGLQRISSYLHFRGELYAPHLDTPVKGGDKLILSDCDIVKELNGLTFEDLSLALQIKLKRAFVRVEVVRKGSDPRFKYHMFKRLNTGGELLTNQQLRNCTIRLLDPQFNDFIIELSQTPNFKKCTEILSSDQRLAAFDQELVLRYFALKNNREGFKHDVADFLTEYMEEVSDPENERSFDYVNEKENFNKTFTVLALTMEDKAFGYANKRADNITKGFGVYHFEAFTIGLQAILSHIDISNSKQISSLKAAITDIKLDREFIGITTGGGKNSKGPLTERISFVETKLLRSHGS
ncbi:DUF262 domain-containing protein [Aquirufa nivalisilvae]|uniref:DUF262 domain-containing protein n=1 Tax=Aquirufa nivalisilvae TaxID=2516557 RepID=UPI0022A9742D|nr:DUF262 domain-containing protein [Aquirufa nivalisilvae]MCZ2480060.1 DUF262 domain-containing protein [Aquirufa nivalisilvae]MCZ2482546.1 DUF262 domain-containing protein [Aquirufa nivalisilvae]